MDLIFALNTTEEDVGPNASWLWYDYDLGDFVPEYGNEPSDGNGLPPSAVQLQVDINNNSRPVLLFDRPTHSLALSRF